MRKMGENVARVSHSQALWSFVPDFYLHIEIATPDLRRSLECTPSPYFDFVSIEEENWVPKWSQISGSSTILTTFLKF